MVPGIGSESSEDENEARMSIFAKEFVPMYHQASKIKNAIASGGKRHPSKDDLTVGESLLSGIGFKVKNYDERKYKTRVGFLYKNRISSLESVGKKLLADYKGGRVDKDKYLKEIKRLRKELKLIESEARKAMAPAR
jgi:hypothetical protein